MAGMICGGIATSRIPASDFGVVVVYVPLARTAARRMRMTSALRSMSPLRNSTIFPNRSAHHDAKVTISRSRSGIASVSTASSATLAGRILWTRLARPAPTIRHGLASMISSLTAEPKMVRSRLWHAIAWWADLSVCPRTNLGRLWA